MANILENMGFPVYIAKLGIPPNIDRLFIEKADRAAKKIESGQLIFVTGSYCRNKDAFLMYLGVKVSSLLKGKILKYVYSPSISYTTEFDGHIIVFGYADQIDDRFSIPIMNKIYSLISSGNVAIVSVLSMEHFYHKFGDTFVQSLSDQIKIINLPVIDNFVLEEI